MRTLTTNEITTIAGGLSLQDSLSVGAIGGVIGLELRRGLNIAQYTGESFIESRSLSQSIAFAALSAAATYVVYGAVAESIYQPD